MDPYTTLRQIESGPGPSTADHEVLQGFALLGVSFASGHTLAFRQFPKSNAGPAFSALWMREPGGDWRIFADAPASVSCAKYMVPDVADQVRVDVSWVDDHTLHVAVPAIQLRWFARLEETRITGLMTSVISRLPEPFVRSRVGSNALSTVARRLLGLGKLRLRGRVPNGQLFMGQPRAVWQVARSYASIGGDSLGEVRAPAPQFAFGEFWIPARPIAMAGTVAFAPIEVRAPGGMPLPA